MSDLDPTLTPTIVTDDDDTVGHQGGIRRLASRVGEAVAECNDATRRLTNLTDMPDREPAYPGASYFRSKGDDDGDDDTTGHQ